MNVRDRMRRAMVIAAMVVCVAVVGGGTVRADDGAGSPAHTNVYVGGDDGYHTYRIPSLVVAADGTLLAFCEARKNSRADDGDIDLVVKRSADSGQSWSPMQVIHDDGEHTIGNPCPVVDRRDGTIWLPFCRDNDRVFVTHSIDQGATWSAIVEITADVKLDGWGWYATGPGCGIQTRSGRLVIPCDHKTGGGQHSHVFFSDDRGESWQLGGLLPVNTDECQVVERSDGSLLLNMRSYHGRNRRAIATSNDGGQSWSEIDFDAALVEPVCQASLLRYTDAARHGRSRLLFSNPASKRREKMTVRLSYDDGRTWPVARQLHAGPAAYSALATLDDGSIGCLYERGESSPNETITFARFSLDWLTDGADGVAVGPRE